jgi:hypothetical protein
MDTFNFNDNFEIGTSISKIKKKKNNDDDLLNLIKDLEERLDNIESSNNHISEEESIKLNTSRNNKVKHAKKKEICIKYQEIIIYMIFFVLLNNKYAVDLIYKIPYVTSNDSFYLNLIIRTLIFGLLGLLYKKYNKCFNQPLN